MKASSWWWWWCASPVLGSGTGTGTGTTTSHLVWHHLVMAGVLVLSASAKNEDDPIPTTSQAPTGDALTWRGNLTVCQLPSNGNGTTWFGVRSLCRSIAPIPSNFGDESGSGFHIDVTISPSMNAYRYLLIAFNNKTFDQESRCNPPCRWPQECNYETSFCECRNAPCNRVVLNGLSWTCQEDVDCAQFAAFSHCVRDTCLCLPGYMATARDKCEFTSVTIEETTTFRSWRPPPTPHGPGPADYSGVVKLALGAAIVMLAGVILALVWNLYRERRRAAQGLTRPPGRRRRQQAQSNSGLPHSHDLPPSYNDIFIISGAEAGRRHEKPPSYEEAMQDQQFAVVAPLAFVNYGFTGEGGPLAPTRRPPGGNSEASGVASALAPSTQNTNLNWQPSLNVASILNRLGSTPTRLPRSVSDCGPGRSTVPDIVLTECEDRQDTNTYPPTNYDGLNVRRTKSGRAPQRRSASDLTRSESTASVAESCCSTSDVTATVVNVSSESMCENSADNLQDGMGELTHSSTLPRPKCSEDAILPAERQKAITDVTSPSIPTDGQNSSTDINKQCLHDGNYVVLQNCDTLELVHELNRKSAPEESEACASASTKVPNSSITSFRESQSSGVSLSLEEDGQHSTADVSFC